ncbi:hypothetical protein [Aquipseudomonas ullengensis]|uniref:Uncharacterized protein n=1 Tax=Aquipseudomonas ullengensis TaxID=2759166 RepID=A0A7W4QG85_9GAMM|nr:hypothetical protein [Pseudomonas ullengensis]MBB2497493.1 hypothetical protein [Pseudomonas ullengensis]
MNKSNESNPGNVQPKPTGQAKKVQDGNITVPFNKVERKPEHKPAAKPMVGNVAEPPVSKAPLAEQRSERGDRRVSPEPHTS